jgi:glutamate dehydrogenase (NADP+)
MFGQYKKLANEFSGVLTGKGHGWGGSLIRPEATGYGTIYFAEEMLKAKDDSIYQKSCLVSGSGNVAQYAVENINRIGGKAVTLSDSSGYVYDKDGIDDEKLAWVKDLKNVRRGRISEYAEHFDVDFYEGKRPWAVEAECAFPCATQNEVNLQDAKRLVSNNVMLVAEGANMPTVPDGVRLFQDEGTLFGPGKAANAGGVATSGLEMSQNAGHTSWDRNTVDKKLRNIMVDIHRSCYQAAQSHGTPGNYVNGANIAGFLKVAEAMLAQGVV